MAHLNASAVWANPSKDNLAGLQQGSNAGTASTGPARSMLSTTSPGTPQPGYCGTAASLSKGISFWAQGFAAMTRADLHERRIHPHTKILLLPTRASTAWRRFASSPMGTIATHWAASCSDHGYFKISQPGALLSPQHRQTAIPCGKHQNKQLADPAGHGYPLNWLVLQAWICSELGLP